MRKGGIVHRIAWGMRIINDPLTTPGGQGPYSQPLIETGSPRRAQIGTRPVQRTPPGDAGQTWDQSSGNLPRGTRLSKVDDAVGLNYGAPTMQIQRFFRAANQGYSGVTMDGWPRSGDNFYVLKRPLQRFPTRGARSVSGAMNGKGRFDDTGRAPSVYVPTTPVR